MRNATNLQTFCFKDHHYESFSLSRDSLSCASRSLDLCILFKFILYLWYIPPAPHSCAFHTFCLHEFFHMYISMRNIFLIPHEGLALCKNLWTFSLFFTFCFSRIYCVDFFVFFCFTSPVSLTGSYTWGCRRSAKARNLILVFNFSGQRPHLNYILLSKVYSLEFP